VVKRGKVLSQIGLFTKVVQIYLQITYMMGKFKKKRITQLG